MSENSKRFCLMPPRTDDAASVHGMKYEDAIRDVRWYGAQGEKTKGTIVFCKEKDASNHATHKKNVSAEFAKALRQVFTIYEGEDEKKEHVLILCPIKDATIVFPECTLGMFAFAQMKRLIFATEIDTSKTESMQAMFAFCLNAKELDLSQFSTMNVTSMRTMFECCCELEALSLKSFDTFNVRDMRKMFDCCYRLKNLDISSFDFSNTLRTDEMFGRCHSLSNPQVNLDTLDFSCYSRDISHKANRVIKRIVKKAKQQASK